MSLQPGDLVRAQYTAGDGQKSAFEGRIKDIVGDAYLVPSPYGFDVVLQEADLTKIS